MIKNKKVKSSSSISESFEQKEKQTSRNPSSTRTMDFHLDMNSFFSQFHSHSAADDLVVNDLCPNFSNSTEFLHDAQSFLLLLSHIEEIGWSTIRLLPSKSTENFIFTIQHIYIDIADRSHELLIDIPHRWPNDRPTCRVHLPVEFHVEFWSTKTSRLIEILTNFHSTVDALQQFWNQLSDIERDAIVLDEKPISYGSTSRKLKINEQIYVRIQVFQ